MRYFTPFYAILRAVPNKLFGVILMGIAVVSFFSLAWLVIYFAFFILMPWYSKADRTKPVPDRVTYG